MDKSEEYRERSTRIRDDTYREFWTLVAGCASILKEIDPGRRKPWLQTVVDDIHAQQGGLCGICGKAMGQLYVEVDHKIPFALGGGNERHNIQLAHGECNRRKQTRVDPRDLLRYLEDRYMNL